MLLMGKSTISMAIFNSYVSLPEGIQFFNEITRERNPTPTSTRRRFSTSSVAAKGSFEDLEAWGDFTDMDK